MAERRRRLFSIPAGCGFADALATGLIDRFSEPAQLARGLVLLPNNRAKQTVRDAFVRASGTGLLLPRLIAIGEADEGVAAGLDKADDGAPVPPAIAPLERRLALAALIREEAGRSGRPIEGAEAVRLAGELARTLDELLVEEIGASDLARLKPEGELTEQWERSFALFQMVLDRWPEVLAQRGWIDLASRRTLLLDRLGARWARQPPAHFVCAAGVASTAPAVARLLRVVGTLPAGMVVFDGLALDLPAAEWDALGPHDPDVDTGLTERPVETHPQYQLKLLLDRMGVGRREVVPWPVPPSGSAEVRSARMAAVANAFAPPDFTGKWSTLKPRQRRLEGVSVLEAAAPAEEAQAIAIALRGVLEKPGRTAALVTPDRKLARRVAAHLGRWGVAIDDTAGRPLALTPPGTLLTALADATVLGFAPLELLALLKHPLVQAGPLRADWLDATRRLDRALRGPRPGPGLAGVDAYLADGLPREQAIRRAAQPDWAAIRPLLEPLEAAFNQAGTTMSDLLEALRDVAQTLCGDTLWAGPEGRAAAQLFEDLAVAAGELAGPFDPTAMPALLADLMGEIAVRPHQNAHPRLAIYGLLEARMQTADLLILGGLNEGVWPVAVAPDPWLAPRIRADLGLPGADRRVGLSAHDFIGALGGPEVILTRARRDASGPAVASRFWLRLQALAETGLPYAVDLAGWARALDDPGIHRPAAQPAPEPAAALRPRSISVTEVDRLKADPYAFYARRILRLAPLDPVDADPSAAWRGTAVHAVLEAWHRLDQGAPERLRARAIDLLGDARTHPMVRALWQPRLLEAVDWIASELARQAATGRRVLAVEERGEADVAGVALSGRFDRVDLLPGGAIAIVDYKTGKAPSVRAVAAGYSLQLGLLGAIAAAGGFGERMKARPEAFEYWSLAKHGDAFGAITSPTDPAGARGKIVTDEFVALAVDNFRVEVGKYLMGNEPFFAKLHPEYAPYSEYDQLMRRDEWYGRERR